MRTGNFAHLRDSELREGDDREGDDRGGDESRMRDNTRTQYAQYILTTNTHDIYPSRNDAPHNTAAQWLALIGRHPWPVDKAKKVSGRRV